MWPAESKFVEFSITQKEEETGLILRSEELGWHKHRGLCGLPFGIGLQSAFERPLVGGKRMDVKFKFNKNPEPKNIGAMISRGHGDHATDKVYLPAVVDQMQNSGLLIFVPFVEEPEPKHYNIEFHRRDGVYAVAGRHGEENAFGLSLEGEHYLRLAFPNDTGRFPDTFILIEKESVRGEYIVVKISSDFAKPQRFEVAKPVIVNWQIVSLDEAPECLKRAAENRAEEVKNMDEALKQAMAAVNIMSRP